MENLKTFVSSLSISLIIFSSNPTMAIARNSYKVSSNVELKTYIIHIEPPATDAILSSGQLERYYKSFLPETVVVFGEPRMVFIYSEVFSGFAARFTKAELDGLKIKPSFVGIFPDHILSLLTTQTPDFLGLQQGSGVWEESKLGAGVIVGMLDSGVDPTNPSFGDDGVPLPSTRWKGSCGFGDGCNNKIIGSRSFVDDDGVDKLGHGTHTVNTTVGNFVDDVSFLGLANGTASGLAPNAHLAIYQVCNDNGLPTSALLAGIDAAVKDGIDMISISIGGPPIPLEEDAIAIGSLGATQKGVLVVYVGGKDSPTASNVSNSAPWIFTVVADTLDRSLQAIVTLGDGTEIDGESPFQPANFMSSSTLLFFSDDCLSVTSDVKGNLAVCSSSKGGKLADIKESLINVDTQGMILITLEEHGFTLLDRVHSLPASDVSFHDGSKIISDVASINFKGTVLRVAPVSTVAFFSTRGPNQVSPGILNPDITGPGVNVLAAWPFGVGGKTFNIISGTSMVTPHLSGISALLKSLHPDWSPTAIKSAIMSSSDNTYKDGARILDLQHRNASFFDMGAGHVNPSKAANPSLVYDVEIDDYVMYLCGLGLGDKGVGEIVRRSNFSCSDVGNLIEAQLNYSSIIATVGSGTVSVNQTITNVGTAKSTYTAKTDGISLGLKVSVEPEELEFTAVGQKMSFIVTISRDSDKGAVEGNLKWVSGDQVVRSPIIVSS